MLHKNVLIAFGSDDKKEIEEAKVTLWWADIDDLKFTMFQLDQFGEYCQENILDVPKYVVPAIEAIDEAIKKKLEVERQTKLVKLKAQRAAIASDKEREVELKRQRDDLDKKIAELEK